MKPFIIAAIFILVFACFQVKAVVPRQPPVKNSKWALDRINALPEVKAFMRYAKRDKPMLMLARTPDPTFKYYLVKLGISNFDIFRTTTDYYIDPKTNRIYVDDPMNIGDHSPNLVTWQQMRRWGGTKGWKKPHFFKNGQLIIAKK